MGNNVPHDEEGVSKLRDEMNMQQQEVDRNYHRLKVKVLERAKEGEFQDHRVRDLWKRAKAGGLSEEELEIMKVCDLMLGSIPYFCDLYIRYTCKNLTYCSKSANKQNIFFTLLSEIFPSILGGTATF